MFPVPVVGRVISYSPNLTAEGVGQCNGCQTAGRSQTGDRHGNGVVAAGEFVNEALQCAAIPIGGADQAVGLILQANNGCLQDFYSVELLLMRITKFLPDIPL